MFFNENYTQVGQWTGSFSSISSTEADDKNMFCLLDDGSWARFTSEDNPDARLNPFRAFYLAEVPIDSISNGPAHAPAQRDAKVFRTLFSNAGVSTVSDGSVPDALNIHYEADIPTPTSTPTGIDATIMTIDDDGTRRYFDIQGRLLNGKPDESLFIDNGRKVLVK